MVAEIKEASPCVDCGLKHPWWRMQFDHTENNKVNAVSNLVRDGASIKLMEEIEKCDLVCANCHADRTHFRRNNKRP